MPNWSTRPGNHSDPESVTQTDGQTARLSRRNIAPIYAAGFVTAFGAHAVAANLGRYALGRHDSLWELGLLLGVYDGAEVLLKPVFGAVVDDGRVSVGHDRRRRTLRRALHARRS